MTKVLIVDDDQLFRQTLHERAVLKGLTAVEASNGREAVQAARTERIDFAVVDMRMPDMDGLVTIAKLKEINPDLRSILLTGHGGDKLKEATEALDTAYFEKDDMTGFWDFLGKLQKTPGMIVIAPPPAGQGYAATGAESQAGQQVPGMQREASDIFGGKSHRIIGQTPAMQELKQTIAKVSVLDCTVLILGETGTGKELAARRIHRLSNRRDSRFLAVNCGSFNSDILSDELFGHVREAFAGAGRSKKGVFESAAGGTILLAEIGDTPSAMQVQILRALEDKTIIRVGGAEEIPVDVRILAAANQSLDDKVEEKAFREDLYYRLNALTLSIPPLRDRRDDIPLLCGYFLARFNREFGKRIEGFDREVMLLLQDYSYPGNVRELENIVERAAIMCDKDRVTRAHLPERFQDGVPALESAEVLVTLAQVEDRHIVRVLKALDGNKNKASQVLGISRASLWRKLKKIEGKE